MPILVLSDVPQEFLDVKKAYQLVSFKFTWCRGGESNPHEVALAGF